MPFRFDSLAIPDVMLVEPKAFRDNRGSFYETYKVSEFAANGIDARFVQDNHSYSVRNVLRGLHWQGAPRAQGKLVRAVRGEIFDVAVDLREGSPSYGDWVSAILSGENRRMLWVPVGFAHGFCVLSEDADVVYKVTEEYDPELETGIVWNDPEVGVRWPVEDPLVSERDAKLPRLSQASPRFSYRRE